MKQKSNKRKHLITALVVLSVVLALLVGVAVYLSTREDTQDPTGESTGATEPGDTGSLPETGETVSEETVPTETQPVDDVVLSTEFCQLSFPGQWKDMLKTAYTKTDMGGNATFTGIVEGKEEVLFQVIFSRSAESQGVPVGVLNVNGEYVLVSVQMDEMAPEGTWSEEGSNNISAMRESINYLLQKLHENSAFSQDISLMNSEENPEDMQIETPFAKLVYPGKWQDQVKAVYTDAGKGGYVTFTGTVGGKDAVLFEIHFGNAAEGAVPVGYVKANGGYVQVSILMHEPADAAAWSSEEQDTFAAMQEGVNDLIKALEKETGFTRNPGAAEPPAATDAPDATEQPSGGEQENALPYVEPWIPSHWKELMRTEVSEVNGGYMVRYIGKSGDHEAVLFTVLYGVETDTSFPVGTLEAEGKTLTVHVELMEIPMDDSWSAADSDTIYAMQESVNEVLQNLSETPGFKAN